jgi:hypothetical protein
MDVSCEGLDRIYEVLAINDASQLGLRNVGVVTYEDLSRMKDRLKHRIRGISLAVQKQLLRALDFLEHIQLEYGSGCNAIRDHFTEAAFDNYDEDRESRLKFDYVPTVCSVLSIC